MITLYLNPVASRNLKGGLFTAVPIINVIRFNRCLARRQCVLPCD